MGSARNAEIEALHAYGQKPHLYSQASLNWWTWKFSGQYIPLSYGTVSV